MGCNAHKRTQAGAQRSRRGLGRERGGEQQEEGEEGGGRAKNEMAAQSSLSTERVQQQSHLSVSVERLGTKSRGGGSRRQVVSQIGQQRRLANDSPEIVAAPCTRRSRHGRL